MLIDLSHRLTDNMPTFPGDPAVEIKAAATIDGEGYLGHHLSLGSHAGTHIDAPAHMLEDGKTLDMYTVDRFVGRAVYILVEDGTFSLENVQNAGVKAGDIVIFNTQSSYKFQSDEYFTDYQVMPIEVAEYLAETQISMVGLDTCSADKDPDFPVHKTLFNSDILIIENLTNVEQLSGQNATITALPLRLNADGAPARVIAEIHS